jgi:hypothetical protein
MGTAMVEMVVIMVEVERIVVYRHDCGKEAPQAHTPGAERYITPHTHLHVTLIQGEEGGREDDG